jgi:hypothetical protein
MHTHLAEVVSKAWLHEGTCLPIQRLAGWPQDLVHNGRHFSLSLELISTRREGCALQDLFLLAAFGAFTTSSGVIPAGAFAL